jgi:Transposase and inactivated derivatives
MIEKTRRKIKDALHKATRAVADSFPEHKLLIGKAFNNAAQKKQTVSKDGEIVKKSSLRKAQAQQVSQACNGQMLRLLDYKMKRGVETLREFYTSQTCPGCGERNKCRGRMYQCTCGLSAPRDVIGASNNLELGLFGKLVPGRSDADRIKWAYPVELRKLNAPNKYPGASQVVPVDTGQVAHAAKAA